MMQPTDFRNRNHSTLIGWLDFSWFGRVAIQGEMRARFVVVLEVGGENPNQVSLVDDDHVIETLTSDRTDQTFHERILPWRTVRRDDLVDAHVLDAFSEILAVDADAI